jgi:hypothetical protein
MTDKELLELAAKAAGIELDWDVPPNASPWRMTGVGEDRGPADIWNPLTSDSDALRLAVKLGLVIDAQKDRTWVGKTQYDAVEHHGNDPFLATRRAIVRAAAEIGRGME